MEGEERRGGRVHPAVTVAVAAVQPDMTLHNTLHCLCCIAINVTLTVTVTVQITLKITYTLFSRKQENKTQHCQPFERH
jgi:hypothetical protein